MDINWAKILQVYANESVKVVFGQMRQSGGETKDETQGNITLFV